MCLLTVIEGRFLHNHKEEESLSMRKSTCYGRANNNYICAIILIIMGHI